MKSLFPIALVIALTSSTAALANEDCRSPMAEWQTRETVTNHVAERGITTDRLRIDDGCYEIRGRDGDGNPVELKIDPASLAILELAVRFRPDADTSRYLPPVRAQDAKAGKTPRPAAGKPLNAASPATTERTR